MQAGRAAATAAAVAAMLGGLLAPAAVGDPPASTVRFTVAGDISSSSAAGAMLGQVAAIRPDLHLAVGDLSYGTTGAEQAWCDFVTARVGAGFPFELLAGNHESNGQNGNINDFSACLPNQLPGLVGTYGRQYYVDVPKAAPLVRFIAISPGLPFPDGTWSYQSGTARYNWTAAAIDGARTAGVPWVVVSMHKPCQSVGQYGCETGSDIVNLMLQKKVDLVLHGHEHLYQRTHQLAHSAGCAAIVPGGYDADCVVDTDGQHAKGGGTVFATVGTGGVELRAVNASDTEAPYFAAYSGSNSNPTFGLLDVSVDGGALEARFVRSSGGTFTDGFRIAAVDPGQNSPPTASFTSSCSALTCSFDGSGSTDTDGTLRAYSWDFGDGASGTGATVDHRYAAAGSYSVRLTVTDDAGATASTTRTVTASAPTTPTGLAADTFGRTVSSGWGTADLGGPWTVGGTAANYSVGEGTGRMRFPSAGVGTNAHLNQVTSTATVLSLSLASDKLPTGSGLYLSVTGRRVAGAGSYQAKVRLLPNGQVELSPIRVNSAGGGEVALQAALRIPDLAYAPGERLMVRVEVSGTNPTTVRAKVWKAGTAEPSGWQRSATDATAALQAGGSPGVSGYLSSSATNAPILVSVDDLQASTPGN